MVGDAAGHGAHDFERIERRDPRAGLRRLDARKRDIQPFGRQRRPRGAARAVHARRDRLARLARRRSHAGDRPTAADPRGAFAERVARPGPARRRRGTRGRGACSGLQTNTRPYRCAGGSTSSAARRSASTSRTSAKLTGPTAAIGRRSASTRSTNSGAPEHVRRKCFKEQNPIAPGSLLWPGGHLFDERQRESAEMRKILPLALQMRDARRVRLLGCQLANFQLVLCRQSV